MEISIAEIETYKQPFDHDKLRRMVEDYLDVTRENAELSKRDRDFFDGDQLSAEEKAVLAKRGQPPAVNNLIAPAINGVLGIVDSGAADPEAFPRTVASQDAADLVTKTLRYLADRADYKACRKLTSANFFVEGTGAAVVEWDGQNVNLTRIRWEDFIHDPLSHEYDFSDSKWMGIAKLLDDADVEAMYPETYAALSAPSKDFSDFFDDKSKARWWCNAKRTQLRVVDLYYLAGGEWHRAVFCQTGMLFAGPCELVDDAGVSHCPIRAVSYEMTRAGDRYGAVRIMIDSQKYINLSTSRSIHLINHRQVRQTDMYAPAANAQLAKREAAKADGVIPFGYDTVTTQDMIAGNMAMLEKAYSSIARFTPTPAVLGRIGSANQSGRARQVLQQAGYTELARMMGRFEAFELDLFKTMWFTARQHLTQPTWIRIASDPKAIEFLQINEPVMGPVATPALDPTTGQPLIDPVTGRPHVVMQMGVVDVKNRLAGLDMDFKISTVPDVETLEQEVFDKIMDTASSTRIPFNDPQFMIMLELSPLPNKRETIDRIKRLAAEAAQQNSEAAAEHAKVAQAAQQAQVEAISAKAAKDTAHASKTQGEADRVNAENQLAFHGLMSAGQPQRTQPPGF